VIDATYDNLVLREYVLDHVHPSFILRFGVFDWRPEGAKRTLQLDDGKDDTVALQR